VSPFPSGARPDSVDVVLLSNQSLGEIQSFLHLRELSPESFDLPPESLELGEQLRLCRRAAR
jgi:hypothetical protein